MQRERLANRSKAESLFGRAVSACRGLRCFVSRFSQKRSSAFVILLLIMLIGLGLRAHFYIGLVRTDSFWTVASAHYLNHDPDFFDYATYYGKSRRILIYGTAVLFALFGESDLSASLLPLIFSVGTIPLLFFLGRRLWSPGAGLLAAGVYAVAPSDVAISSCLLPDPIMPFFIALALFLFVAGHDGESAPRRISRLMSVGGVAALAFLVRENGPVVLGIFGLYWLLFDRARWRRYVWIGAGFLLVLTPLLLWLWDDVLLYFGYMFASTKHTIPKHLLGSPFFDPKYLRFVVTDALHRPIYIPTVAVLATVVASSARRRWRIRLDRGIKIVLSAFLWMYLYLDFVGPHLYGHGLAPRYTSVLLPIAALALGWGLWRATRLLSRWLRPCKIRTLLACAILATGPCLAVGLSFGLLGDQRIQYWNTAYWWKEPARSLSQTSLGPVYFLGESSWDKKMSFFLHYAWPDVPYFIQATKGEYVYPGVKPEYLGEVAALEKEFREWRCRHVMDDPEQLASLSPRIHRIEDAYVLTNPNSLAGQGLDFLIPDDWQIVERFQECRNWRKSDRILYYAPPRETPPDSGAWMAAGRIAAMQGDLAGALQAVRSAMRLDPANRIAREFHELARLWLRSRQEGGDELNVALLRAGTRIAHVEGLPASPFHNVAQALTLPRANRWAPQHYCHFSGNSELPIVVTLEFGQTRTIHSLEIQWMEYPSSVGSAWEAYGDPGDGGWRWLGIIDAQDGRRSRIDLQEAAELARVKLVVTAIGEAQRSAGLRIRRIVIE